MVSATVLRKLEPHERETIITFDRQGDVASVFTYERTWQTHCEKVLGLEPVVTNRFGGKAYEMPKKWIRKPRKTRTRTSS